MGLFDFFKKRKSKGPEVPAFTKELAPVSYAIAYFVLPNGVFRDPGKFVAIWTDPAISAGPLLYGMGCQFNGVSPAPERAPLYKTSSGEFDEGTDFYLLEYPEPPPLDFSRLFPGKKTSEAEVPVLTPYFSAMLRDRATGAVSYYVLGQSPVGGGTTLRSVTRDGVNGNLGPGPAPKAEAFLDKLRATARADAQARSPVEG